MNLETNVECQHDMVALAAKGWNAGICWCRICGTIEDYAEEMDPYHRYVVGRMVPVVTRGFNEQARGI